MTIDPEPEFDLEALVTVGIYASSWEAQLARACLEAEGIGSVVADEHLGRIWCATTVGGIKLRVREEDAPRASELLRSREPTPELYVVTDSDLPLPRRCPLCKSDNLSVERWSVLGLLGAWLFLGMALPVPRRRWTCHGCGADLGLEPETDGIDQDDQDGADSSQFTSPAERSDDLDDRAGSTSTSSEKR